ncbi:MAG: serine hydrolase domain-containing protein [Promethearchaeota archaeon]
MDNPKMKVINNILVEKSLKFKPTMYSTLEKQMRKHFIPGVSIAVINDYKIDWTEGFGVKEKGKNEIITSETLFQAGSISKPVAALGALRLVQEDKIGLDDDVNDYLKTWKIPKNGDYQPRVTVRQILSHTAGITVHGFPGYPKSVPLASEIEVLNGEGYANTEKIEVDWIPGLSFRYSGGGYTILQHLMADITGQPFPELMNELVLNRLGMTNSTYSQPLPTELWGKEATGHHNVYGNSIPGKWHIYPEMAAAGLWTTPTDLAKFTIEIQLSKLGKSNKIISKSLTEEMLSPQKNSTYGLGFGIEKKEDQVIFQHGGWDEGFVSSLVAYADHGKGIVVMTNKDFMSNILIKEIVDTVAHAYNWSGYVERENYNFIPDSKVEEDIIGKYELESEFFFEISKESNQLFLQPTGQPKIRLFTKSELKYFTKAVNVEIEFTREKEGTIRKLILKQGEKEFEAKRV